MQHSVKEIATRYSELSDNRKDRKRFTKDGFIKFVEDNMNKYSIIVENDNLLVSTWYSGDLIEDYRKTL